MPETYKANFYERLAQRFIKPLFIKDGNNGFAFSSTATFVRYEGSPYCIFAAHAIQNKSEQIENIGLFLTNGEFVPLIQISIKHKLFSDLNIVICRMFNEADLVNYFDLSTTALPDTFDSARLGWIGFPKKKAVQGYHKTRASSEHVFKDRTYLEDGTPFWKNAKFLIAGIEHKTILEVGIRGRFENKNVEYMYEGFKQQGYGLVGMSGGAIFCLPKKILSPASLCSLFYFAGIGLEYDGKFVTGASRQEILTAIIDV